MRFEPWTRTATFQNIISISDSKVAKIISILALQIFAFSLYFALISWSELTTSTMTEFTEANRKYFE